MLVDRLEPFVFRHKGLSETSFEHLPPSRLGGDAITRKSVQIDRQRMASQWKITHEVSSARVNYSRAKIVHRTEQSLSVQRIT